MFDAFYRMRDELKLVYRFKERRDISSLNSDSLRNRWITLYPRPRKTRRYRRQNPDKSGAEINTINKRRPRCCDIQPSNVTTNMRSSNKNSRNNKGEPLHCERVRNFAAHWFTAFDISTDTITNVKLRAQTDV